jgi:xanthine dehydrogenase large subunit
MPSSDLADVALATAVVHKPLPHDSARLHVQGAATYIDDIGEPAGTLHIAIGMANKASGKLKSLHLETVRAAPGVVAVLTAADIPGKNDIAPVFADEPLFVDQDVMFHGQALFAERRGSPGSTSRPARRRSRSRMRLLAAREFKMTIRSGAATQRPRSRRPDIGWKASFQSAGRSISILKGRRRSPFRAKLTR